MIWELQRAKQLADLAAVLAVKNKSKNKNKNKNKGSAARHGAGIADIDIDMNGDNDPTDPDAASRLRLPGGDLPMHIPPDLATVLARGAAGYGADHCRPPPPLASGVAVGRGGGSVTNSSLTPTQLRVLAEQNQAAHNMPHRVRRVVRRLARSG